MNKRVAPVETAISLDPTPAEDDIIAAEQSILAAFDASDESVRWDIRIIKLDKNAGNAEEYLFSVTPDELDGVLDRVRDSEGTGHYRMRAYKIQGNVKRVFKAADFRVRAPAKPAVAPERPSEMTAVLQAMKEHNQQTLSLMREIMNPLRAVAAAPVAPADHWGELQKMVAVITSLQAAVRPPEAASATSLLLEGVKLAQTIEGGDKTETNLYDVVKTAFENIGALAKVSNTVFPARQLPAPSKTTIKQPTPPATANADQSPQAIMIKPGDLPAMKQALAYLLDKARRNSNTDFYAAWITDNWSRDMLTWALQQPDLIGTLQSIEPQIAEHREWFTRLIASLKEMVNSDGRGEATADVSGTDTASDLAEDTGRSGGRESDPGNHEWPDA